MATVRKRGRGFQLIYQVDGERHFETVYGMNESEAWREMGIRIGQSLEGRTPTVSARRLRFEDLAIDLENEYKAKGRRSGDTLKYRLANLKSYFGGRQALSINTPYIRGYTANRLAEGASPGTVRAELAKLKAMFNLAIRSERLNRKPYIPLPCEGHPRKGFFDAEYFSRVLVHLPDHLKPVAQFGYYTGWRRTEITSLEWSQIDLEQQTVRLWAGTTKNDEGRVLPLGPELSSIIREQLNKRVEGCRWVFHRNGHRILTFYKAWRDACKSAGCPGMLFHDLRRTAARNFTRAGITTGEAMALGGWKTDSTFKRYSITEERDLPDAAWRAQAYLAEGLKKVCQECANGGLGRKGQDGQQVNKSVG